MTTAKNAVYWVITWKLLFSGGGGRRGGGEVGGIDFWWRRGGDKNLVRGRSLLGGIFLGRGEGN